jgi:chloramphenicol-sensitive protein RarD
MPEADLDTAGQNRTGLFYAVAAFIWWPGSVFYFKAVEHISPLEVLAHRVIWTAALLVTGLGLGKRLEVQSAPRFAGSSLLVIL